MRRCRPKTTGVRRGCGSVSGKVEKSCSGTTQKVVADMDDALKEAIRRSLMDNLPKKKTEVKEAEIVVEPCSVTETFHDAKEEKETSIQVPIAREVVEISAGNEDTQKALDSMDPKMKKAISRSLNEFFARRTQGSVHDNNTHVSTDSDCDSDNVLSAQAETQKRIDSMDNEMKESIRRSLNQFFATRRAAKEGPTNANVTSDTNVNDTVESPEEMKKTHETLTAESKEESRRALDRLLTVRARAQAIGVLSEDFQAEQEKLTSTATTATGSIPNVVVDIVLDDDDDDLSEGTLDESRANTDDDTSEADDDDDTDDTDSSSSDIETKDEMTSTRSGIQGSGGNGSKDEWQMVTGDDEMIAMAAQMLGSALFQSDSSIDHSA